MKCFGLVSPEVSKEPDKVTYLYDTEPTLSMVAEESAKLLAGTSALPVLFIGSGLTRRYLDLPNREGLLRKFCVYGKFGKFGYRGLRAEELYLYALGKSELEYDDEMILREAKIFSKREI